MSATTIRNSSERPFSFLIVLADKSRTHHFACDGPAAFIKCVVVACRADRHRTLTVPRGGDVRCRWLTVLRDRVRSCEIDVDSTISETQQALRARSQSMNIRFCFALVCVRVCICLCVV